MSIGQEVKPQLHVSMLDTMSRCGIQFQRRYGYRFGVWDREEIIAPGVAIGVGIAVDKSVNQNMTHKMQTGELLSLDEVRSIARDSFESTWGGGMMLSEDEAISIDDTKGEGVDTSVALAALHYKQVAPAILPLAVQEKFVIELKGFPVDIAGTKDIREENCIRDTKTKASTPPPDAAKSMQMATYAIAESVRSGKYPAKVALDFLVKTKTPKVELREATPDPAWIDPVFRRIERAIQIIETVREGKQAFTPAQPDEWTCTKRFCGFAQTCPFWSGR